MTVKDREHIRIRKMGPKYMVTRASAREADAAHVFTMNEPAAYLLGKAAEVESFDEQMLLEWLTGEYEVEEKRALDDIRSLLESWKEFGLIVE